MGLAELVSTCFLLVRQMFSQFSIRTLVRVNAAHDGKHNLVVSVGTGGGGGGAAAARFCRAASSRNLPKKKVCIRSRLVFDEAIRAATNRGELKRPSYAEIRGGAGFVEPPGTQPVS